MSCKITRARNWPWLGLGLILTLAGCNASPAGDAAASSPVGVVNIDRVASELGLTQQVTQILQAEDQNLVAGLADIKQTIQGQFDAKRKQVGESPSANDRQELQAMELQANQILENMRMRSQARLQEVRAALVQQVRLKFSESIQGVAKSHQMKVVLISPSDAVIFSVATVDITAELIETLRPSSASIKLEPPAPAPGLPTSRLSVPPTTATVAPTGSAAPTSPGTPAPAPAATPAPTPGKRPENTTGESK